VGFVSLWCLLGGRISKDSGRMGKECSMHGNESNVEWICVWKMGMKESIKKDCVTIRV
jgi:hypothetical protein